MDEIQGGGLNLGAAGETPRPFQLPITNIRLRLSEYTDITQRKLSADVSADA